MSVRDQFVTGPLSIVDDSPVVLAMTRECAAVGLI